MSGADGRKEWKFIKGINDYGKEQTYMYLGERSDDGSGQFAWDPLGTSDNETLAFLWKNAYLVALFTPFALAVLYAVSKLV
jgi:hypothetical protein